MIIILREVAAETCDSLVVHYSIACLMIWVRSQMALYEYYIVM